MTRGRVNYPFKFFSKHLLLLFCRSQHALDVDGLSMKCLPGQTMKNQQKDYEEVNSTGNVAFASGCLISVLTLYLFKRLKQVIDIYLSKDSRS